MEKKQDLESLVNSQPTVNRPIRKFLVDTSAMISYSIAVGMANEMLIAGMSLEQSLKSRAMSIIPNMLTGGIYGKYRDWVLKKFKTTQQSHWLKKAVADITAFASFQGPLYATILTLAGADSDQIMTAVGSITLISPLLGRPYGLYLDGLRKISGVRSYYSS